MIRAYILHCHHDQYDAQAWHDRIQRIQELRPDRIICYCAQEMEWNLIYNHAINLLTTWLVDQDCHMYIINPHTDADITSHIHGVLCYGFLLPFAMDHEWNSKLSVSSNGIPDLLYTCYVNNPRVERAMIIDALVSNQLLPQGMVTCRYPEQMQWTHHDGSRLIDEPDYTISATPSYSPTAYPRSFFRGWIDIVCESHVAPGMFFVSEKTLKSIWACKPFLALAPQGFFSDHLQPVYGLEPYTELFDYAFDSHSNIRDRVNGIVDNLLRLSRLTDQERRALAASLSPKLERNKWRMLELFRNPAKMIPECLKFVIDDSEHELLGDNCELITYATHYAAIKGLT